MIREHWEEVEDGVMDRIDGLVEMALPKRRRLTEREQLQRYLSYGPDDFDAMRAWLSKEGKPEEFDRYVTRMEKYRSKDAKRR